MIGIILLVFVLLLMFSFAISAFFSSKQDQVSTLTKKELRETLDSLQSEQEPITKTDVL
ncbi:hypothetical protein [Paenisporosarcina quisquiliarum]|uniref:hypothetical protein n=1 Tax=Paenisporosarcina quisquiliarum TaxID=365346 RepID=UPI00373539CF